MTHSTRRSYKQKWEEAKEQLQTNESSIHTISEAARVLSAADSERKKEFDLIRELAAEVTYLVEVLDHDGKGPIPTKDLRKPIDANLHHYDSLLILRRTRDIVRHAASRVGFLGMTSKHLTHSIEDFRSVAEALKAPIEKTEVGMLSYYVGGNPTLNECEYILNDKGRNPRTVDYLYTTDQSDSEEEEDNIRTEVSVTSGRSSRSSVSSQVGEYNSASLTVAKFKPSPPGRKAKTNGKINIT